MSGLQAVDLIRIVVVPVDIGLQGAGPGLVDLDEDGGDEAFERGWQNTSSPGFGGAGAEVVFDAETRRSDRRRRPFLTLAYWLRLVSRATQKCPGLSFAKLFKWFQFQYMSHTETQWY